MLLAIPGCQSFMQVTIMGGKALASDFSSDVQQAYDNRRFCFTATTLQGGGGEPIFGKSRLTVQTPFCLTLEKAAQTGQPGLA
jgi:hypothetical protein